MLLLDDDDDHDDVKEDEVDACRRVSDSGEAASQKCCVVKETKTKERA